MFKRSVIFLSIAMMAVLSAAAFADGRSSVQKAVVSLGDSYLVSAPAAAFRHGIALLPLKVPESLASKGVGAAVEAFIREKLSQSTVFILVERSNMAALMKEMELGMSGIVDESTAAKAGALIGAELLVQGSISETGGGLSLSLEIVDVSTGTVAASITRALERADLIADASQFQRDAFRSQYGLSTWAGAGVHMKLGKAWVPDYDAENVGAKQGYVISGMVEGGVAYRLFPFLSLDLGIVSIDSPQMYFNDTGRVDAPLHDLDTDYTLRYSMFHGMGPSLGLGYVYSPIPRLNLGLRASGFMLTDHYLEHWFMGMPVWDVAPNDLDPDGVDPTIAPVQKDLSVFGTEMLPPMGASGSFKADYLISRRLSLSLELGYFWMPPYLPVVFQVGDTMQNSNQDEGTLSYIDRNGIFAIMGGYNVARIDGTPATGYISYDPSGLTASLSLAIHF